MKSNEIKLQGGGFNGYMPHLLQYNEEDEDAWGEKGSSNSTDHRDTDYDHERVDISS